MVNRTTLFITASSSHLLSVTELSRRGIQVCLCLSLVRSRFGLASTHAPATAGACGPGCVNVLKYLERTTTIGPAMEFSAHRFLQFAIALGLLGPGLAACTSADFEAMFPPENKPAAGAPDAQRRQASPPASAAGNGATRTALARPPTPRPDPPTPPAPLKLIGLSRGEAESLLGPPAAEAERSPAKVWQYRAADCTVDVYFYLDVARNEFYALHYEARGPQTAAGGTAAIGRSEAADRCLRRIHDANRTR